MISYWNSLHKAINFCLDIGGVNWKGCDIPNSFKTHFANFIPLSTFQSTQASPYKSFSVRPHTHTLSGAPSSAKLAKVDKA